MGMNWTLLNRSWNELETLISYKGKTGNSNIAEGTNWKLRYRSGDEVESSDIVVGTNWKLWYRSGDELETLNIVVGTNWKLWYRSVTI